MNSYFQLINGQKGSGVRFFPATDGGEKLGASEVAEYLQRRGFSYDLAALNKVLVSMEEEPVLYPLPGVKQSKERECVSLFLSPDKMVVEGRFYAPSNDGEEMGRQEILDDLKYQGINYGIDEAAIDAFVKNRNYCENIVLAKGLAPVEGEHARIEYFFNTDTRVRPTLLEDGSVDFFHLNTINHCQKGEMLAKLHKEKRGTPGYNVVGETIPAKDVKTARLSFGKNMELSEDGTELTSTVNGHVSLVEGRVFVSDVFVVENVDTATGNIEYEGSVQVNGNVCSNYAVKAGGNVEIRGVVEGAKVEAGGNIIIARGVNGMGKGDLKAGGNIVAKFIENATVAAGGYVESGSIMHSRVSAKTEINVGGKRGFITGGEVSATLSVNVKTLGSTMGADTIVNVGVDPQLKAEYQQLQKQIAEIVKLQKNIQPVIQATTLKLKQGVKLSPDQIGYVKSLLATDQQKQAELAQATARMEEIENTLGEAKDAHISVTDTVYPGTTLMISDASMVVQKEYKYCRFIKKDGDVKMAAL